MGVGISGWRLHAGPFINERICKYLASETYLECPKPPDGIYIPCGGWGSIHSVGLLERDLDTTVITWMNAWLWSAMKRGKVAGSIEGVR